jgi:leader peptidase (prepilin peptidase)/N-methyltransferase
VKVAALCGAIVGLKGVPMMLTLAFVVAGVISLVLLLMRLRGRHDAIALTPFLGLGAAVTVLLA